MERRGGEKKGCTGGAGAGHCSRMTQPPTWAKEPSAAARSRSVAAICASAWSRNLARKACTGTKLLQVLHTGQGCRSMMADLPRGRGGAA